MKPGTFPPPACALLETYCSVVARSRSIAKLLGETDANVDFKRFRMLLNLQARTTSLMAMLATRLRILPRNNPRQNRHEPPYAKPWEIHPE
jgi:hypothetical protein